MDAASILAALYAAWAATQRVAAHGTTPKARERAREAEARANVRLRKYARLTGLPVPQDTEAHK